MIKPEWLPTKSSIIDYNELLNCIPEIRLYVLTLLLKSEIIRMEV